MLDAQAAWIGMAAPGKVEIDQSVVQGDAVKAGPVEANVLHTPGHTEGSICLYFPLEKKLIAGDTFSRGALAEPICREDRSRRSSIRYTRKFSRCRTTPWSSLGTDR